MQTKKLLVLAVSFFLIVSCQKENQDASLDSRTGLKEDLLFNKKPGIINASYDLNVKLRGACSSVSPDPEDDNCPVGHLKFRQDRDAEKIIDLDVKIHNMLPNHEYLFQRAVDPINMVDGSCSSTNWLTLGKGLVPHSLYTDKAGNGKAQLWRDVTAIPSGASFDIHFRVVDAVSMEVVLTSDCYQYKVR